MENLTLTKLALVSRRAREDSAFQFTSLAHLLNVEFLRGCYRTLGKEKADSINGKFYFTVAVKGDWLKSRMREIFTSGSVRGVKLYYKAEYCGTPQSKERRNREYKVCLNERALRLLDQTKPISWRSRFRVQSSAVRSGKRVC
jgi:hypothetical protein